MSLNPSNVLTLFLEYLQRNGMSYCIVGNTDDLPDGIAGDVDIIIPQQKIKHIHSVVLSFCKDESTNVVQCLQHENNAFYYVIQWWENNIPKFIKFDICGDYYRKASLFLKADDLLSEVREAVDNHGNGKQFFIAAPAIEFIYYLLKKIDKGSLNNEQAFHLHKQWKKDPEGCFKQISHFWDKIDCSLIKKAAESNDWNQVIKAIPELKRSIHRKVQITWAGIGGELRRKIRRVLYPTGLTVAFLGPDGSGKSSVLQAVANSLAPAFRKQAYYHLRPFLLPGRSMGNGGIVTNPHAYKKYSVVLSIMKLIYLWSDYFIGHFTVIKWKKIFSTFVLFDRYFQDVLVDPKRFRYGGPLWLVILLGRLLPMPDALIFLNTSVAAIQKRKKEVSDEECDRQVKNYEKVAGKMKNAIIFDAAKPLNDVVFDVNKSLLTILAQRTEKRLRRLSVMVV